MEVVFQPSRKGLAVQRETQVFWRRVCQKLPGTLPAETTLWELNTNVRWGKSGVNKRSLTDETKVIAPWSVAARPPGVGGALAGRRGLEFKGEFTRVSWMQPARGKIVPIMKSTRPVLTGLLVAFCALTAFAGKKNNEPPAASVNFVVVRDANGKPVKNAEVVLHPVDKKGKQRPEGMELKTHEDGKAEATGLAYGKWRVQVIAPGFKTYGQDYDLSQPSVDITIKLLKPSEQYSIYK
jgi:hypothetical protein